MENLRSLALAGKDGTRTREVRRKRKTAENLKRQPKLAKAAAKGKLSEEQLNHASDLAGEDPAEDERWAEEAPDWSPEDLAAKVRALRKPTPEDGAARRAARELRCWWRQDHGMAPQGRWLLLGNPNNPAGLSLIDRDDLPKLATLAADHARAGPSAA